MQRIRRLAACILLISTMATAQPTFAIEEAAEAPQTDIVEVQTPAEPQPEPPEPVVIEEPVPQEEPPASEPEPSAPTETQAEPEPGDEEHTDTTGDPINPETEDDVSSSPEKGIDEVMDEPEAIEDATDYESRETSEYVDNGIHTTGRILSTLSSDNVSGTVAEDGYFPSKSAVLKGNVGRVGGPFFAAMICWHYDNGASCYRIKDTTPFYASFGGTDSYTPRPGDLLYYQAFQEDYDNAYISPYESHWLHAGIVVEVGDDYITTIEGNVYQTVSRVTQTPWRGVIGNYTDYRRSWVVDVFHDDEDAREAFVATAEAALSAAEDDAEHGRCGYETWCESCYHGTYQNDVIPSGYFRIQGEWCQMFVLWCAFHARAVREGSIRLSVSSPTRSFNSIIAVGEPLWGYAFSIYELTEDGIYTEAEPICTVTTDPSGFAESPELLYGMYHIEQTGGDVQVSAPQDITIDAKKIDCEASVLPDDSSESVLSPLLSMNQYTHALFTPVPGLLSGDLFDLDSFILAPVGAATEKEDDFDASYSDQSQKDEKTQKRSRYTDRL